jgi:hypothetical protein
LNTQVYYYRWLLCDELLKIAGQRNKQNDLALGKGEINYPDGTRYQGKVQKACDLTQIEHIGQLRDGKKHGIGTFTW